MQPSSSSCPSRPSSCSSPAQTQRLHQIHREHRTLPSLTPITLPLLSAPTTPQLDERAQGPKPRPGLPVPALLAIVGVSRTSSSSHLYAKKNLTRSVTVLLLGITLAYIYVRRRRVHQKRIEHRVRAAQFQEMHRSGARPYYAGGSAPIAVSLPFPGSAPVGEKREMTGPRYPMKAYVM